MTPKIPKRGEQVKAEHIQSLWQALMEIRPVGDKVTINTKATPHGTIINGFGSGKTKTAIVYIKSKIIYPDEPNPRSYMAELYLNGLSQPKEKDQIVVKVVNYNVTPVIDMFPDSFYMAQQYPWLDYSKSSPYPSKIFWTIDPKLSTTGVWGKLKTKTDYNHYIADFYGNGKDKPITQKDVTVYIPIVNQNDTVPFLGTDDAFYWCTYTQTLEGVYNWSCQPQYWA